MFKLHASEQTFTLTPWVPAALVMQGWLDIHISDEVDILPSKDIFCPIYRHTEAHHSGYQSSNKPFMCQNFKTNYNIVPYSNHGTERVNDMLGKV